MPWVDEVQSLIEEQGTTLYVSVLLDELSITYVEDVPKEKRDFFVRRCRALQLEDK